MRLTRERTDAALAALFWVPVVLAAVWIVVWPPQTVDGPAHLLGATAIAEHGSEPYASYYELDWFPTPNLAGTALLAALVKVGSLRFAETVLLLLASLATPLALRWAIRVVRPESAWLAIAGLPLCFGYLYFYGFWNYCIGIALAMVCAGMALRAAPAWRPGPTLALAGVLTLTWLTHLVPFAAAALFVAAVVVTGPRTRRSWLAAGLTLVPGAVLSVAYLAHTESGNGPTWTNPVGRAVGLISLHTTITTYSRAEDFVAVALALVLLALVLLAARAAPATGARSLGAAAGSSTVAAAVLVLIAPTNFGLDFGLIDERLAVFPVLFGLLWLAARPPAAKVALAAATVFVVATGALAGLRISDLRDYDDFADEYASAAGLIEPESLVVALRFHIYSPDAGRNAGWDPTRHLASGLAASTRSVDIGHYEAVLDYFPATFTPEFGARRAIDPDLDGLAKVPPEVNLDALVADLGRGAPPRSLEGLETGTDGEFFGVFARIDPLYVLVIGAPDASEAAGGALAATRAELERRYVRVGATAPRGLVEVWRAKDAAGD